MLVGGAAEDAQTEVVEEPVADTPIEVEEPVADAPIVVIEEPVADAPVEVVEEPVADTPVEVVEEPVAEAPIEVIEEPVADDPLEVAEEPVADDPIEVVEEFEEEPVVQPSGGDLLSLHYDNAPDRDDGHALVAGRVLVETFGVRAIAVNGTYGYRLREQFQTDSVPLFALTWPNGLDAFNDPGGSVASAASIWSETIRNGGTVYVAEGGPSEFTAEVLRELPASQHSSVTVVQHSAGFNQNQTSDVNLKFVQDVTNYINIDDGNLGNNETADLNMLSSGFVETALNSIWSVQWAAAFDYLDPVNDKLDFSDAVEVLFILDVPFSRVSDVDDFADEFLSNNRQAVENSIQNRNFPQAWVSPLSQ